MTVLQGIRPSLSIAAPLHPCSRGIPYILCIAVLGLPVLHGIRPSLAKKKACRAGLSKDTIQRDKA